VGREQLLEALCMAEAGAAAAGAFVGLAMKRRTTHEAALRGVELAE